MKRTAPTGLFLFASLAAAELAPAVWAQSQGAPQTPRSWNYEVDKRGNRVSRDNRVMKPDGSWREEIRQGNCITVKERSATGEYRETRQCNGGTPR